MSRTVPTIKWIGYFTSLLIVSAAAGAKQWSPTLRDEMKIASTFVSAIKAGTDFDPANFLQLPSEAERTLLSPLRQCKSNEPMPGYHDTVMVQWDCGADSGKFHKITMLHFQDGKIGQISVHDMDIDPKVHVVN